MSFDFLPRPEDKFGRGISLRVAILPSAIALAELALFRKMADYENFSRLYIVCYD